MKVLMVTSSYPLFEGDGTAPFIEETARALVARGHRVDLVLPAHPLLKRGPETGLRFFPYSYAPLPGLNVWGYARSMNADRDLKWRTVLVAPLAILAAARAISRRLRTEPYDVVHAHWVVPGGYLSRRPARSAHTPLVISLHGSDVFSAERTALVAWAARRAFDAAAAVTACSSDLRHRALRLGAPAGATRTVPYGVDTRFFSGTSPMPEFQRLKMRERLGVGPGQTLVVAVGRLVEKKGFAHLVDALGGVAELHLAVIGDGDLDSGLRARSASSGTSITFAGRFSRTEIRDALRSADVVAVPSVIDSHGNVDGLPNVLLEAMSSARAIVASRVAGIPDVVTDGVEGLLVPPGAPRPLRDALLHLAKDPVKRAELGRGAWDRVHRDLTWDRVASTLEECYVQARALAER